MSLEHLQKTDPQIYDLIRAEEQYQVDTVRLIPSENYASAAVMEALGLRNVALRRLPYTSRASYCLVE